MLFSVTSYYFSAKIIIKCSKNTWEREGTKEQWKKRCGGTTSRGLEWIYVTSKELLQTGTWTWGEKIKGIQRDEQPIERERRQMRHYSYDLSAHWSVWFMEFNPVEYNFKEIHPLFSLRKQWGYEKAIQQYGNWIKYQIQKIVIFMLNKNEAWISNYQIIIYCGVGGWIIMSEKFIPTTSYWIGFVNRLLIFHKHSKKHLRRLTYT